VFKFWKLADGQCLYFGPDGGGGGGDEAGAGDDDGGHEAEASTGLEHPDFVVPGGEDGSDAGEGDATGQGAGDLATGAKKKPAEPVENVPKHRLDDVIRQRDEFGGRVTSQEAELKKLRALVAGALGITDPDAPAKPRELTAREQAVQKKLFELIPGLEHIKDLVDQKESLLGLAASVPDFERQNKQYWDRVAKSTMDALDASVAKTMLGDGKTAKDLPKEIQARFRRDFFNWVQNDAERQGRYESLDATLIEDFAKEVDATLVAPLRRRYGADVVNRAKAAGKLPIGGSSSAPVSGQKPKEKPSLDEDTVADAAWTNFKERQSAAG